MKKAYLVDFNVCTRVIVDPDDPRIRSKEIFKDIIIAHAHKKVMKDISSRLLQDNAEINEDLEVPYEEGEKS